MTRYIKSEALVRNMGPGFDAVVKAKGKDIAEAIYAFSQTIFDIPNLTSLLEHAGDAVDEISEIFPYLVTLTKDDGAAAVEYPGIDHLKVEAASITLEQAEAAVIGMLKAAKYGVHENGWDAHYADTHEKQNCIEHHYTKGPGGANECTFQEHHAEDFKNYDIFNAVTSDIEKYPPKIYANPKRHDEYGPSVFSIFVNKRHGNIFITNRHNNYAEAGGPDTTFFNFPDNIYKGLNRALDIFCIKKREAEGALEDWQGILWPHSSRGLACGYVHAGDRIFKYNYHINGVYFGKDFYVKGGVVHKLAHNEVMMDYLIFNARAKEFSNPANVEDSFVDALMGEVAEKSVSSGVVKIDGKNVARISLKPKVRVQLSPDGKGIELVSYEKNGKIVKAPYGVGFEFDAESDHLHGVTPDKAAVADAFNKGVDLKGACREVALDGSMIVSSGGESHIDLHDGFIKAIVLTDTINVKDWFLIHSLAVSEVSMPKVVSVGDGFLPSNVQAPMKRLDMPMLKIMGNICLKYSRIPDETVFGSLEEIGSGSLRNSKYAHPEQFPSLMKIGEDPIAGHASDPHPSNTKDSDTGKVFPHSPHREDIIRLAAERKMKLLEGFGSKTRGRS